MDDEIEELLEEEGIDKDRLDIAIEAAKVICDECPPDSVGKLIGAIYKRLERLEEKEEKE